MNYLTVYIMDIELNRNFIFEAKVWCKITSKEGEFIEYEIVGFDSVEVESDFCTETINELVEYIDNNDVINSDEFYRNRQYSYNYSEFNCEVA